MEFLMSDAINRILKKIADPKGGTYLDTPLGAETKYDGRAKDTFWDIILEILLDMYKDRKENEKEKGEEVSISSSFSEDDIRGLIKTDEQTIDADGKIDLSTITDFFRFKNVYPDHDKNDNQLTKKISKVNIEIYKSEMGENFREDDAVEYRLEGTDIIFYPKDETGSGTKKLQVLYVAFPDIKTYNWAADNNGDEENLLLLFSLPFIIKAIELAVIRINRDKQTN